MLTEFQKRIVFVLLVAVVATFVMIPIKKQYFSKKQSVTHSKTMRAETNFHRNIKGKSEHKKPLNAEERRKRIEEIRARQANRPINSKVPNALDYMAPGYDKAQERLNNLQNMRQKQIQERNKMLQNIR